MDKSWQEMTTDEKVEDLRSDVRRAFSVLRSLRDDLSSLQHRMSEIAELQRSSSRKRKAGGSDQAQA
jgi:predicted  nucleic acid-binding Zn-ribbon protein